MQPQAQNLSDSQETPEKTEPLKEAKASNLGYGPSGDYQAVQRRT